MRMPKNQKLSRRNFVKTTTVAAAAVPAFTAKSYANIAGANGRLNVGLIGCGGIARSHLRGYMGIRKEQNLEMLEVCDVFETRARTFQDQLWRVGERTGSTTDYRRLLENKDLDYVTICTPEHWHARQTIDALDRGLHVYCEKPITHRSSEAQDVLKKVAETGLKMQVGVQGMSDDSYESAGAAIRAGKLGPVIQAQIDYVRNYTADLGPWRTGVDPDLPLPSDMNWNSWLGHAKKRPWSPNRYFEWRCYSDYSGGIATDLFIHRLTRLLKACQLTYPTRVSGMGGIYLWDDGRDLPDNMEVLLEYPAVQGITPGMTVHLLGTMANRTQNKHIIRGKAASLIFSREGWEIVDETTGEVSETHQKSGAESIPLHHSNLHAAIRDNQELHCPAELGAYGITAVDGANQSWLQHRMLEWDTNAKEWA